MRSAVARFLLRRIRPLLHRLGIDLIRWVPIEQYSPGRRPSTPEKEGGARELVAELHRVFPFPPESDPSLRPFLWNLDGGGRELVEEQIGSFLGGSAYRWLTASPELVVVCVDPWSDGWAGDYASAKGRAGFQKQLNAAEGLYRTFLLNLTQFRDRVVPVRGLSPQVLPQLFVLGFVPDLVFFDSTKRLDDLPVCHRLWPEAIFTGDDWFWADQEGDLPAQRAVKAFAAAHGFTILHQSQTWVLARNPVPAEP
jgi:hypothetical protein